MSTVEPPIGKPYQCGRFWNLDAIAAGGLGQRCNQVLGHEGPCRWSLFVRNPVAAPDTQPLTPGDTGTSARAQGSTTEPTG